jgi:hypothetical protein
MSNNDPFSKILDIAPLSSDTVSANIETVEGELVETGQDLLEKSYEETQKEYENIKNNLIEVIETGRGALEEVNEIAQRSQDYKYYDVLSKVMNSLIVANRELTNLVKTKSETHNPYIEKAPKEEKSVTNNLFIGSTAELLSFIKGKIDTDGTRK